MLHKVINQAQRVCHKASEASKRAQAAVKALIEKAQTMGGGQQVIQGATASVFDGNTKVPEKVVTVFEPHTEISRK